MNKQEVTFKRKKIDKIISKMFTLEERLEYLDFLLSHFYKIYDHESNEDIKKFISDYNLKGGSYYNAEYLNNTWKNPVPFDDKMKNFKYFSPKFRKFLDEMMQLIIYLETEKEKYENTVKITNSVFLNILEIDILLKKLNTFNNVKDTFEWLNKYLDFLINLSYMPYRFCYDSLYKKHNLEDSYPMLIVDKAGPKPYYVPLRNHLISTMIPFTIEQKNSYELKVKLDNAKEKYPDKFIDDDDKYPLFNFYYDNIQAYSSQIFLTSEEKLEYYLYIIHIYNKSLLSGNKLPSIAEACIKSLKVEVEDLKELVKIGLAKMAPLVKPVDVDTSKLTDKIDKISNDLEDIGKKQEILTKDKIKNLFLKHYLNVALQLRDIPKQYDLITERYNKTFISRQFSDINFLTDLANFLNDVSEDERYNARSLKLIINCKNSLGKILQKKNNKKIIKDHINPKKVPYKAIDKNGFDLFEGDEDMKYLSGEDGIIPK